MRIRRRRTVRNRVGRLVRLVGLGYWVTSVSETPFVSGMRLEFEGMSSYVATVIWTRPADAPFKDNKYSRAHEWHFDGGTVVPASSVAISR